MNGGDKEKMGDIFELNCLFFVIEFELFKEQSTHLFKHLSFWILDGLSCTQKEKEKENIELSFVIWSVTKMSGIQCPRLSIVRSEKWIEDEIRIVRSRFLCFDIRYVIRTYLQIFRAMFADRFAWNYTNCKNETL